MKAFLAKVIDVRDSSYLISVYWLQKKHLVY
jgi:hypothetical protein